MAKIGDNVLVKGQILGVSIERGRTRLKIRPYYKFDKHSNVSNLLDDFHVYDQSVVNETDMVNQMALEYEDEQ